MGYILKKGTGGGGGGDATAANQQIQINLETDNTADSVFKQRSESVFCDDKTNADYKGVFKNQNSTSVFKDELKDISTFNTDNGKSILNLSKITGSASCKCVSFQNTTPALLASDIESFLQGNACAIISIVYADAGGIAPNPHTALIIYNIF